MKSIELTKKHKSKLLEMCNVLFPEYKYWNLHDGTCDLCTEGTLDFHENKKPDWNSWNRIHWFEFCVTHLVEKLSDSLNIWEEIPPYVSNIYGKVNGKWNLYTKFNFHYPKNIYKIHPIDYLYKEFKKLK